MKNKRLLFLLCITVLLTSIIFFVCGILTPMLSTKVDIFGIGFNRTQVNILDSIGLFFRNKEYFLAIIITLFCLLVPAIKYTELIYRCVTKKINKQYLYDKWSMLDVFLVALLILNFKMGDTMIVMELRIGTMYIALAIITRIIAIELIEKYEQNE